MLLRQEVVQLSQPVLFAHQEEALALKPLLRPDLLLRDRVRLLCNVSTTVLLLCGLGVDGLDIPGHLQFVEDELPFDLWLDLADDAGDLKALMGNFLESQAAEELVLDEDLLDAGVGAELETAKELVRPLHADVDPVVLAEALDLLKLRVEAVDEDQVLRLCLNEELLESVAIHASFKGQVARSAFDLHFSRIP